jgi:DNA repair exonuclease SbcCD ATPase subunit
MGFVKLLKRAFGFGADDSEADDLLSDSVEQESSAQPSQPLQQNSADDNVFSEDMQQRIFDGVINVFNAAQPDFIRKSLNTDEQRKFLYDSLDASIKDYISKIATATQTRCENRYRSNQNEMKSEVEQLKENARRLETQREELKQQQLSAERQKRALSDRLNELEKQVADLEAEREQADLVNRGLMNKLKVAGVQQAAAANESFSIDSDEDASKDETIKQLNEELEKLRAENKELSEAVDVLKDKSHIADELVNDMRRRAAEARQELEKCQAELNETKDLNLEIEQLHEQMTHVDEVVSKRDAKIAALTHENEELKTSETQLNEKIKALQSTITELESRPVATTTFSFDENTPVVEQPQQNKTERHLKRQTPRPIKIERPKISDNELAEMNASFETSLGEEHGMSKDPEFGYHAPRRQQYPESDAQMSLPFD